MSTSIFPDAAQAAQQFHTLRDILRWAVSLFNAHELQYGQGTDNAWDEAVYLGLSALRLPVDMLEPFLDAQLAPAERQHLCQLMEQRVSSRLPAAYLLGEAWLQGYRFHITQDCIIPRSPIAELLVQQLSPWIAEPDAPLQIMDLCTGSGCLAIIAALHFPHAQVNAVDISAQALAVAQKNIADYDLHTHVHTIQSDLLATVPVEHHDLIICNPPYVNSSSMQQLPAEFRHEPALALAGGDDGMDLVRKILQQVPAYLSDNGLLILEIGHEYDHFMRAFPTLEPIWLSTANAENQILLLHKEQLLT